jgi:hypothetical protein
MDYKIRVRAKDEYNYLSVWSDPLNLNIPRLKERFNFFSFDYVYIVTNFKNFIFLIELLFENHRFEI